MTHDEHIYKQKLRIFSKPIKIFLLSRNNNDAEQIVGLYKMQKTKTQKSSIGTLPKPINLKIFFVISEI